MIELRQILGSVVAALAGAFCGMLVPGDGGLAHISLICLLAFFSRFLWVRRRQPLGVTLAICGMLLVVWWPLAILLRSMDQF